MECKELKEWKDTHGADLTIGTEVKISPACPYYEEAYDRDSKYVVVMLYSDSGGLNIGIGAIENGNLVMCDADGYRISDLMPIQE